MQLTRYRSRLVNPAVSNKREKYRSVTRSPFTRRTVKISTGKDKDSDIDDETCHIQHAPSSNILVGREIPKNTNQSMLKVQKLYPSENSVFRQVVVTQRLLLSECSLCAFDDVAVAAQEPEVTAPFADFRLVGRRAARGEGNMLADRQLGAGESHLKYFLMYPNLYYVCVLLFDSRSDKNSSVGYGENMAQFSELLLHVMLIACHCLRVPVNVTWNYNLRGSPANMEENGMVAKSFITILQSDLPIKKIFTYQE